MWYTLAPILSLPSEWVLDISHQVSTLGQASSGKLWLSRKQEGAMVYQLPRGETVRFGQCCHHHHGLHHCDHDRPVHLLYPHLNSVRTIGWKWRTLCCREGQGRVAVRTHFMHFSTVLECGQLVAGRERTTKSLKEDITKSNISDKRLWVAKSSIPKAIHINAIKVATDPTRGRVSITVLHQLEIASAEGNTLWRNWGKKKRDISISSDFQRIVRKVCTQVLCMSASIIFELTTVVS